MNRAFLIFGCFFLGITGLFIGQFIIFNNFLGDKNALIYTMFGASFLIFFYVILIWTISDSSVSNITDDGIRFANKLPIISIIGAIIYLIYSIYYQDYLLHFVPYYWVAKQLTTFDWVFLGLFYVIAMSIGTAFFARDKFSTEKYVEVTYEKIGNTNFEVNRSTHFIDKWQFVGMSFVGLIVAILFAFTPFILVVALYYIVRFLITIFYVKKLSNKSSIHAFVKKQKRILLAITLFGFLSLSSGVLYLNGIFNLPNTFKEVELNSDNLSQYVKVSTLYSPNEGDSLNYRIGYSFANRKEYKITNLAIEVTFKYKKIKCDNPSEFEDIVYIDTKQIDSLISTHYTVDESSDREYHYEFVSSSFRVFSGHASLIPKMDNGLYIRTHISYTDGLFVIENRRYFLNGEYHDKFGIFFKENIYAHSMRIVLKDEKGLIQTILIDKTFIYEGDYFPITLSDPSPGNNIEILYIRGLIKSFYL